MKKFENPEMNIVYIAIEDVITTSIGGELGENQTPPVLRP